jgi:hypothetical protein
MLTKIEFHEIDNWNLVGGTSEMYATIIQGIYINQVNLVLKCPSTTLSKAVTEWESLIGNGNWFHK